MAFIKIAKALLAKVQKEKKEKNVDNHEFQSEMSRIKGVRLYPLEVYDTAVVAVVSGDNDEIEKTKMQLYVIVTAYRSEFGAEVEVIDSGEVFIMQFDNSCAAEFVWNHLNGKIEK